MKSVGCLVVFALLALLIFNVMGFSSLTAKADKENLFTPNDWPIFRHEAHHTGE
jgi:Na+-transporting methylmalonyl-CoA/oxaloacetate decarboxylase gamma subunit